MQGFFPEHPESVSLMLPRWQPSALLIRRGHPSQRLTTVCDTLVIDTEQRRLSLIARTLVDPSVLGGHPAWLRLLASSSLAHEVEA